MSNQDSFYPRLIIQEYFDTLINQLNIEMDAYLAESKSSLSSKDTEYLNLVKRQLVSEILRLRDLNLANYAKNSKSFLESLERIRSDFVTSEEKKINIIYKLLFSSGYCFFIEANQTSRIKRLVVLDCFPNNNNLLDSAQE